MSDFTFKQLDTGYIHMRLNGRFIAQFPDSLTVEELPPGYIHQAQWNYIDAREGYREWLQMRELGSTLAVIAEAKAKLDELKQKEQK